MHDAFLRLIASSLKDERFTLVDVGCSGGVDAVWRVFGERFRALAFDASVSECRRLQANEPSANVHYVPGFVGIPLDHPFARQAVGKPSFVNDFYGRTSAAWTMEMRAKRLAEASNEEKMRHNLWQVTELAEADKPIFLKDALPAHGFEAVDFLKIDVDGHDLLVLKSLDGMLDKLGVLAARLEVCMFGGADDTNHTFHNTDRFMLQQGYALMRLDNRSYSNRALPARYAINMPAQTVSGRFFQDDASYARDLAAESQKDIAAQTSVEGIAKLAAILSVWQQPDGAAELLIKFKDRLASLFDVDRGLDLLAAQTQSADGDKDEVEFLSYRDYVKSFTADGPEFYPRRDPPPPPEPTFWQRVAAARAAWDDWGYTERLFATRRRWEKLEEMRKARDQAQPVPKPT